MPAVDDGSDSVETSVKMLEMMKEQKITDVIATPHFYPNEDNLEDYKNKITSSFNELKNVINGKNLPNIYIGCEVLYFNGIGSTPSIQNFCIGNTNYILIELAYNVISAKLFKDLINLKNNLNLIPIIAHVERYFKDPGYKKLLRFIGEYNILTQVNASSIIEKPYNKVANKLIKKDIVTFIGTDAHSCKERCPRMLEALTKIKSDFGESFCNKLINNSQLLLNKITTYTNGDFTK